MSVTPEFILNSPPQTTLLLGLATGALIARTIKSIARNIARRFAKTDE